MFQTRPGGESVPNSRTSRSPESIPHVTGDLQPIGDRHQPRLTALARVAGDLPRRDRAANLAGAPPAMPIQTGPPTISIERRTQASLFKVFQCVNLFFFVFDCLVVWLSTDCSVVLFFFSCFKESRASLAHLLFGCAKKKQVDRLRNGRSPSERPHTIPMEMDETWAFLYLFDAKYNMHKDFICMMLHVCG